MTKLMTIKLNIGSCKYKGQLSHLMTQSMTNKEYIMSTLPELSNTNYILDKYGQSADLLQITVSNSEVMPRH